MSSLFNLTTFDYFLTTKNKIFEDIWRYFKIRIKRLKPLITLHFVVISRVSYMVGITGFETVLFVVFKPL